MIEEIILQLDGRRRPGTANITVFGTERPGGPAPVVNTPPPPREGASVTISPRGAQILPDWQSLGSVTVGFSASSGIIRVGRGEDWYRDRGFDRLHFRAERSDIHMNAIRVVYMNGFEETYRIDRNVEAGGILSLDLPGRRSFVREIGLDYRSRQGYRGQAFVTAYGEQGRR